jgi:hypothetical protein
MKGANTQPIKKANTKLARKQTENKQNKMQPIKYERGEASRHKS